MFLENVKIYPPPEKHIPDLEGVIPSCKTHHPGKKEDTPQRDGGPGPPPIRETKSK
jgi:hypothetical protein